jgi:hypothetical protein
MSVLIQMLEHFRSLAGETEEEIKMIEDGRLAIIRHGHDYSQNRLVELRARLEKLHNTLSRFGSG